ncbi:MAG: helix-turn-helix domain-containing protein [Solirubrobacterales bacterium]
MSELGTTLRTAREHAGVSQRRLARRSGIAQSAISRIERGAESPSFERFAYLLSCLGLEPSVELNPLPYRGDRDLVLDQLARSPSERLAGAVNDAKLARELRTAVRDAEELTPDDRADSTGIDAGPILSALGRHELDYLLFGGFAVFAHGYPRLTADLDLLVRPDVRNYARLARAIAELDPDWRPPGGRSPGDVEELGWGWGAFARFHTPYGPIDAHRAVEGGADYEELDHRAIEAKIGEITVRVVGYDDLIRIERAAGRPQDLADIAALEDARRTRKE